MGSKQLILVMTALLCVFAVASAQNAAPKQRVYLDAERSEIEIAGDGQLQLHYYDNVLFRYKGAVLHCDTAVWYESRGILEFWGNVEYSDSLHDLRSRYLRYLQTENRFISTGACELVDKNERIKIRGETVGFDRNTGELMASASPYLAVDYDDPYAIIEITSDTLHYASRDKHGKALGNVRIVKGSMVATCDMCEFFPDSNLIILQGSPYAWQRLNELEGDTMYISLVNKQIDQIRVSGNGRALYRREMPTAVEVFASEDTMAVSDTLVSVDKDGLPTVVDTLLSHKPPPFTESRIESKSIVFLLENEVLSRIISAGNSYSWHTPAPEDTIAEGKNEASGDSILLFFGDGNLDRVEINNSCVGTFFSQMTTDSLGQVQYLDTVKYESSRLSYNISDRIIYLLGGAEVNHQTVTLIADTITYNTATKDIRAFSSLLVGEEDSVFIPVYLKEGTEEMMGERLVYNLDTKRGKVKETDTELDRAFYHGEIVRKVDDDVLFVDCGKYIPCEYRDANFHFWSRKMKIITGDKVIAKPIVLYIEHLPVLYAPFFVFSIKKGRHSGFLPFWIGSWERGGRFVENLGYYWAISDYWDLATSMYMKENVGVGLDCVANYRKRYIMSGTIKGSYARDSKTSYSGRSVSHRWSLSFNHSHTLTQTASISGSGSFVSDKDFTTDISNDIDERLNRNLRSQVNFSKRWESASLTAVAQSTEDLDRESSTLTLPKLNFRLNSRPLVSPPAGADRSEMRWYHNTRFSYDSDFQNYQSEYKSGDAFTRKEYSRATHNVSLSSPQTLLTYVTVNPSLNYTENWFHIRPTDQTTKSDTTTAESRFPIHPDTWSPTIVTDPTASEDLKTGSILRNHRSRMSIGANTKLYGHFFPPIPGLIGIRHSMTPSVSFSYTPRSETNAAEARFVGATSSLRDAKSLSFSLSNLFQMKYRSGDQEKKLDLFTLSSRASYNFEAEQRKWSSVSTSLRSTSIPVVNDVTVQATHDLYNPATLKLDLMEARLTNISISTGFSMSGEMGGSSATDMPESGESLKEFSSQSHSKPWSLNVSYRYGETRTVIGTDILKSITHWITTNARFFLTDNFDVSYSQNYDIRRKLIVGRSIRVTRDLRCWQAEFLWYPNGSLEGYYFKIYLKQLPEVKLQKSESPLRGTLYK